MVEGADGLVYASGFTSIGEDHAFAVTRFADGAIDPTFGTGGTAVVNVAEGGGGAEVARGLVVQSDGKVLVAGPVENDPAAEGDAAKESTSPSSGWTPRGARCHVRRGGNRPHRPRSRPGGEP